MGNLWFWSPSIGNNKFKKIGIIYQDKNLLSDFSALENIFLARLAITNDENKAYVEAKKLIRGKASILAKIEKPSAVESFDEILKES